MAMSEKVRTEKLIPHTQEKMLLKLRRHLNHRLQREVRYIPFKQIISN